MAEINIFKPKDWELELPVTTVEVKEEPTNDDVVKSEETADEFILPDIKPSPITAIGKKCLRDWVCSVCNKRLTTKRNLMLHMARHGEKTILCEICSKKFHGKPELMRHMRIHSDDKPYSCKFCERAYKQSGQLNIHLRRVHPETFDGEKNVPEELIEDEIEEEIEEEVITDDFTSLIYESITEEEENGLLIFSNATSCEVVSLQQEQEFDNKNIEKFNYDTIDEEVYDVSDSENQIRADQKNSKSKKRPVKTRKTDKKRKFVCDQCGLDFPFYAPLDEHLRRHNKDKRYKCELCPEKFIRPDELKRHMAKHTGDTEYVCHFCDRLFFEKGTLIKHERTHTNERPFVCKQCGKAFTASNILTAHMVTHNGERPFECGYCNMTFKRKTHLVTHNRSKTHQQNEENQQKNVNDPKNGDSDDINVC